MQALLTVIVAWLSINFGLPAPNEPPRVELASPAIMAEVRYSRLAAASPDHVSAETRHSVPPESFREVYAIYDDKSRTIYLPEGWTAESPAEVSMLVHELVHHLQNVGGLKYACPEAREKPAYQAQARWLSIFGKTLSDEFGIDAATLLVRTNCMH